MGLSWATSSPSKAAPLGNVPATQESGGWVSCLSLGLALWGMGRVLTSPRASGASLKFLNPSRCLVSAQPSASSLARTGTQYTDL